MEVDIMCAMDRRIGEWIRQARLDAGMSLADTASASLVSEGELASIEEGASPVMLDVFVRLCHAYDASGKELVEELFAQGEQLMECTAISAMRTISLRFRNPVSSYEGAISEHQLYVNGSVSFSASTEPLRPRELAFAVDSSSHTTSAGPPISAS